MAQYITAAQFDALYRPDPANARFRFTPVPVTLRAMHRVSAIGRSERLQGGAYPPGRPPPPASHDFLVSMHGRCTPVAYLLSSADGVLDVRMGTWAPDADARASSLDAIESALGTVYPGLQLERSDGVMTSFGGVGLGVGIPKAKSIDARDDSSPWDRIVLAMRTARRSSGTPVRPKRCWAVLILAEPLPKSDVWALWEALLTESSRIQGLAQAGKLAAPDVKQYVKHLDAKARSVVIARSIGGWHMTAYLLGDGSDCFNLLSSAWRAAFAGDGTNVDPTSIVPFGPAASAATGTEGAGWAAKWGLAQKLWSPTDRGFRFSDVGTFLSTSELALYAQLPTVEFPGFQLRTVPRFDAVQIPSALGTERTLSLGRVILQGRPTERPYRLELEDLSRHMFVAGVTGAGKTRTILHVLKEAARAKVHFLVIEPAKTEYRSLLEDPLLRDSLQVFTLGNEAVSPLRLNPFEVPHGVPIGLHLDLLRSVFAASFGMWAPLPQILEQALYGIYRDRGWNIVTGENDRSAVTGQRAMGPGQRSGASHPLSFPTLTDLIDKVDDLVPRLGYDVTVTGNMKTALHTRLDSLRVGGKGRMLDVHESFPDEVLFARHTVLELEAMGDDDDKAFLMALLLVRLVEYRRRPDRRTDRLSHLLVIEEAHRLLSAQARGKGEGEADPRAKAVEGFANLISEVRSYGQGIIIADQVPAKLAPDVIKNTTTKIVHRIVAADDRETLAGCMAMNESQSKALAVLSPRQAVVFTEEDDAPILIEPTEVPKPPEVVDASVRDRMSGLFAERLDASGTYGTFGSKSQRRSWDRIRDRAAAIARSQRFRDRLEHFMLVFAEQEASEEQLSTGFAELRFAVRQIAGSHEHEHLFSAVLVQGVAWFVKRKGDREHWTYPDTQELLEQLITALVDRAEVAHASVPQWQRARALFREKHRRAGEPYPGCDLICEPSQTGERLCLYRTQVANLIAASGGAEKLRELWVVSQKKGPTDGNPSIVSRELAERLVDPAMAGPVRRVRLCIVQHAVAGDTEKVFFTAARRRHLLSEFMAGEYPNG